MRLPDWNRTLDCIYYYREEATPSDAHRMFLFVFLHQDRYEGYLWFSSLPQQTIAGEMFPGSE